MPSKKIIFENEGKRLAGVLHFPTKYTNMGIVISYGLGGNMEGRYGWMPMLADSLCRAGYAVLRFDYRGSGESEGRFIDSSISTQASDLSAALDEMIKFGYNRLGILGMSFGGGVAVHGYHKGIDALALWNPITKFEDYFNLINFFSAKNEELIKRRKFALLEVPLRSIALNVGEQMWLEAQKTNLQKKLEGITCPVLLLHGDADDIVPLTHSTWAKDVLVGTDDKTLTIVPGAGHNFYGFEDYVYGKTVQWFSKKMKP